MSTDNDNDDKLTDRIEKTFNPIQEIMKRGHSSKKVGVKFYKNTIPSHIC